MSNMTSQKTRSSTKETSGNRLQTGNWSKTFPSKIDTSNKSLVFVKKLLTVSISNITYLRSMFPEDAYVNRSMDGIPLKILKEKNQCDNAATLARWMIGAFDALSRKFLKELLLIINLDSSCPNDVYEMYTFKFSYPDGLVACQITQGESKKPMQSLHPNDVYNSTQQLLRNIIEVTQGLPVLPTSAFLSMKLLYYDEVTPEGYEPPGFGPVEYEELKLVRDSVHLGGGEVFTNHHMVKLKVHAKQAVSNVDHQHQSAMVTNTYCSTASESDSDRAVPSSSTIAVSSVISTVACMCQNSTLDSFMLTCFYCSTLQHAACYRMIDLAKKQTVHCCVSCSIESKGARVCTDPKLVKMSSKPAVVLTCVFRRVLNSLLEIGSGLLGEEFFMERFGVTDYVATGLMDKLANEGIVQQVGEGRFRVVKGTLGFVALPKYLGVKKVVDCSLKSIVEKAEEMDTNDVRVEVKVGSYGSRRERKDALLDMEVEERSGIKRKVPEDVCETTGNNAGGGSRSSKRMIIKKQ